MEIKISDELNSIINYARQEAMRTGSYGISPDHLFLGIIRHEENTASDVLKALGTDMEEFKKFIDDKIFTNEPIPYSEAEHVVFSRGTQNVLSITVLEASRAGTGIASSQHLLLALCRGTNGYGIAYLRDTGIDYGSVASYLEKAGMLREDSPSDRDDKQGKTPPEDAEISDSDQKQEKVSPLEEYGVDITEAAAAGKLDPVIGRDREIERVIQILGRRKKNNPMLVGDPGVGKSAVVEGIAQRIADGKVPGELIGKRLISLDIASVVAGTKYRGDFEKRLKAIIKEVSGNQDIILFVDEFHTLIGAGGTSGSLDAANMLKPALARGEIHCIGATTMDEFTRIVEKDGALDRRFQKVVLTAPDTRQTIAILEGIKAGYEKHHSVIYTREAIEACVRLSDRYITDRCMPDKAIDAMDEAGSMVHLRMSGRKNAGKNTDKDAGRNADKDAGRNADKDAGKTATVTADDIATVISRITGVPVGRMMESENIRLLKMEERLKERIIGQDQAVAKVVRAIRRNRAGLKDPGRPVGTFLFLGPTGVGKTQLAKVLADYMFDGSDNLVRIDMSEYMEKFSVSRLIGAPPGYVGYEEGGQLSEKVRRKPYCVVLLDEIEKAHPDIFNLLLQVLDEGRLTDSNGRTVDFRNTILIMTSNVGSRETQEYGSGLGYSTSSADLSAGRKAIVEKNIRKVFPPEFINRIDEQVFFNTLRREDIESIIDIELKALRKRVTESGFKLHVTPAAKRLVAAEGYDPKFGARPLKRAVRRLIEDPVSEFVISQGILSGASPESPVIKVGLSHDKTTTSVSAELGKLYVDQLQTHVVDHVDQSPE